MGKAEFVAFIESMLSTEFPGRWGSIAPGLGCWVDNGLAIAYGDRAIQFRIGIAQGLALSEDLVRDLATINTTLTCGSVWIAEDAGGAWQVLWGDRRPWALLPAGRAEGRRLVQTLARSVPAMLEVIAVPIISRHAGQAWERDIEPASSASLLMAIST